MMIGTELKTVVRRDAGTTGTVRLAVDGLSVAAEALHAIDLKDISFDVRSAELFGIAGVAGNRQPERLLAMSGVRLAELRSGSWRDRVLHNSETSVGYVCDKKR